MVGCPDSECHNRVEGHTITLFGKDGLHGIAGAKGSLNELKEMITNVTACVTKKTSNARFYVTLGVVISTMIGLASPFIIKGMDAWSKERIIIHENKSAIIAQQEINKQIKHDIKDIKNSLNDIKDDKKELIEAIGKIVKKAVREVNDER